MRLLAASVMLLALAVICLAVAVISHVAGHA